ncbi:phosphoadenosine phosphosulfate reductase domain-containing protein [Alkalicoccobacillus gibsonii]|uniref:phosphoadenosine phosphosulfate reductase domain-containing protein n=1 Tax=Alkalicoccobacillus gibsonii TaxID=79881 RepID=UPI003F7C49D9
MKHIVSYSGGIGSWMTAKRVIEKYGKENVLLLFTDTLIEDEDLYRFIDETVKEMGTEYIVTSDGRTPWEVFKDVRWLGNSRVAQCSYHLKQKQAAEWIKANYSPDECILYLGIDWTEDHRRKAPTKNWAPYRVEFPMCEAPYLSKQDMLQALDETGIKRPRLYDLGFSHNNCGGMCVKGGQGHFIHLLKTFPDRYKWIEGYEKEMQQFLGQDVTILKRTKNKVQENLSLETLRKEYEAEQLEQIDLFDFGGCGCYVDGEEKALISCGG